MGRLATISVFFIIVNLVFLFTKRTISRLPNSDHDSSVSVRTISPNKNKKICSELKKLSGTDEDARPILEKCIREAEEGSILEIPLGNYTFQTPLLIQKKITLLTEGKKSTDETCKADGSNCAEFSAGKKFSHLGGFIALLSDGIRFDHLVVNGKRDERSAFTYQECKKFNNSAGFNMVMQCSDCQVTKSVIKNAACGTGIEIGKGNRPSVLSKIVFSHNKVLSNGIHHVEGLWSDGATIHDAIDSEFNHNEFRDNTDVDFIFGGCQNCSIQKNSITHSKYFSSSAFAGLMIQRWQSTSGDYTNTEIADNTIDGGEKKNLGFGFYLGSSAWYKVPRVFGGKIHDNTVKNSQAGLVIDDAKQVKLYQNRIESSLVPKIITSKAEIELGKDLGPFVPFVHTEVEGKIPNNFKPIPRGALIDHQCLDQIRHPYPHFVLKEGCCVPAFK